MKNISRLKACFLAGRVRSYLNCRNPMTHLFAVFAALCLGSCDFGFPAGPKIGLEPDPKLLGNWYCMQEDEKMAGFSDYDVRKGAAADEFLVIVDENFEFKAWRIDPNDAGLLQLKLERMKGEDGQITQVEQAAYSIIATRATAEGLVVKQLTQPESGTVKDESEMKSRLSSALKAIDWNSSPSKETDTAWWKTLHMKKESQQERNLRHLAKQMAEEQAKLKEADKRVDENGKSTTNSESGNGLAPPIQLGTPVLDKFEQLEASAPDPGDLAEFRKRAGELDAAIEKAKAAEDIAKATDLICDLHVLGLYYGRTWPTLNSHLNNFRDWLKPNKPGKTGESRHCNLMMQYYKILSFSHVGWNIAGNYADSLVNGNYGLAGTPLEGQGNSFLARNGLDMIKNRGGWMAPASVKGRPDLTHEQYGEKSLELQPNSPRVRATWSMVLAERGELPEAIRQADAAVALCPKSSTYLANRAYVKCLAGYPFAEIDKDWESALAVRKNNPLVYYDRAMYRLANQSVEKAVEDLDRAIEPNAPCPSDAYLNPAVAWSLNARGEILKAAGETEKALADFKLAAATGPRGTWTQAVCYKAGLLLANSGRVKESVDFFRGAQDMYYQSSESHRTQVALALASAEKGIWPPRVETRKFTDQEIMVGAAAGALLLYFVADAHDQARAESAMRGGLSSSDLAALAAIDDDAERERERLRRSQKASQDYRQWQHQNQTLKQSNWNKTMITPLRSAGTFRHR